MRAERTLNTFTKRSCAWSWEDKAGKPGIRLDIDKSKFLSQSYHRPDWQHRAVTYHCDREATGKESRYSTCIGAPHQAAVGCEHHICTLLRGLPLIETVLITLLKQVAASLRKKDAFWERIIVPQPRNIRGVIRSYGLNAWSSTLPIMQA